MNQRIELEESICLIQKEVSDTQRNLRENERETKKWTDKLEIATNSLKFNSQQKKHIKSEAEVVELKEYQRIQEKIEEMNEEIKECNLQLSVLRKAKLNFQSSIALNTTLLTESRRKLSTYGIVIPLKGV